jgi:hypothetical protein
LSDIEDDPYFDNLSLYNKLGSISASYF